MDQDRKLRVLERQIWELFAWRNVTTANLEPWTAVGADGARCTVKLGERWDDLDLPVRLETTLPSPAPVHALLEFIAEGDGLVFLDGKLAAALNPFEREVPLGGARHILVEISSNDAFGETGGAARLIMSRIIQPDRDIRALHCALVLAWETCVQFPEHQITPLLLQAISESLALVRLPSDADLVLKRAVRLREELELNLDAARALNRHYSYMIPRRSIERMLSETTHLAGLGITPALDTPDAPEGVPEALAHLNRRISDLAKQFPSHGGLAATAHAHLDVAWLWPLSETHRKNRHTFASVLSLMDRYPDFHFTASSAQLFTFVQQDDPELFERIRQRVAEGRIEPIGGMWLEPDCNLTSGESLIRHLLYGQRYFDHEFGRRSTVAWMPDTFGLAANLPQILAGAGIRRFFTQKLTWNDTNQFPYDLWLWEGLDGTPLVAHSFNNPVGGYNGQVTPEALEATWNNFRGKVLHPESLFTFGMGDGGRGPTSEMLERLRVLDGYPALPSVRQTTVEEFFSHINPNKLPVWLGELYLEFHRGTYTTQSRIKRLNRMAEQRLQEAETAATLESLAEDQYPRAELDNLWKTLLLNQFHDILPGSSIREVNEEAERQLGSVVEEAVSIRDRAVEHLGTPGTPAGDEQSTSIVVFNPQGFERSLSFLTPAPIDRSDFRLRTADGREVPWQRTADGGVIVHDPGCTVPGVGYIEIALDDQPASSAKPGVTATESVMENDVVRVFFGEDGFIQSLIDKRAGNEIFTGPGNQLRLFHDLPGGWEAWNVTNTSRMEGDVLSVVASRRVVENGPLRAMVEFRRHTGSSTITQRYVLRAGSPRLDIHTVVDWQERRRLLRAFFPLAVRTPRATFETSYGAVERPTHRNTSWDIAKFEVPGQRWADLSEPDYGVSLLNDGRYGHSALGSTLGLSLLRSPIDPDPLADLGQHEFTYSILPHLGEWHEASTVQEAIDLNSPLIARTRKGVSGTAGRFSWLGVEGLTLGALKRAEDSRDIVLRLFDPYGRRGIARVTPHIPVEQAALTNLLEESPEALEIESDGSIQFPYTPFQILTLRLSRPRVHAI